MTETETTQVDEVTSDSLREQGNKAIQESKFEEAVLHYSYAIKLDPQNYTLYSNRSLAHLKLKHYYLAYSDAKETIALNPYWPKGYFRKGEVEFATQHYTEAYESYKEALKLKPDDSNIVQALNNTAQKLIRQRNFDRQIPWFGAGLGIIVGVNILLIELFFTQRPSHPLLMALITIMTSFVGYGIARVVRSHMKSWRTSLLDPPPSLEENLQNNSEEEKEEIKRTPRYTKSQARLRYKKGKV